MSKIVEKNKFGFYSVIEKPNTKELEEYYNKKYYQSAQGSYELNYSDEEITFFLNKINEKVHVISKFKKVQPGINVIDIGCGEGWVLRYFNQLNIESMGLDYSSYGVEKFNCDYLNSVLVGDVYKNVDNLISQGKQFDIVWLDNVLEHVVDPLDLLYKCKNIMKPDGILMVEVPNDFSVLQKYLLENGHIDNEYWVAYPDHLSYFNKEGLIELAKEANLNPVFFMGDFPIDLYLLNPNTNYNRDKTKGKSCYLSRLRFENLANSVSVEGTINLYKALMDLGFGRALTGFFVNQNGVA